MSDLRLIVFCKAPVPGEVKTRLMSKVGAGSAANIHARLATETIGDAIKTAKLIQHVQLELWCTPNTQHPFFHSFAEHVHLCQQKGDDLGERMAHALCSQSGPAMLIGTDCPPVNCDYLVSAARALEKNEMVLAPAEDGGYGLIGMQQPNAAVVEEVRWSTEHVMQDTLDRCRAAGIKVTELPLIWDVDEPADLDRWLAGVPPQ